MMRKIRNLLRKSYLVVLKMPLIGRLLLAAEYGLYLRKKAKEINKLKGYKFIFLTDSHWGANAKRSPLMIKEISKKISADMIVFGGDFITHSDENKKKMIELGKDFFSQLKNCQCEVYPVLGNHDDNSYEQNNSDAILSTAEIKDIIEVQSKRKVIYGSDFDCFFDIDEEKIRFVFLNTANRICDSQQLSFLTNTLISTHKDYQIIVVGHIWMEWDLSNNVYVFNRKTKEIVEIVNAYNKRLKQENYDFSEASASVSFLLGGHIHNDYYVNKQDCVPIILCDSDSYEKSYSGTAVFGTPKEQRISVITIGENDIKLVCIGHGKDFAFKRSKR